MKKKRINYDGTFKILILGETGVGKTSLLMRYVEDEFTNAHLPTIGIDFKIKEVSINHKIYKLQIWDTAGQERFRTITKTYYRSSNGIILTYDVTNLNSFNKIRHWIQQINENAPEGVSKILVGNKCDKSDKKISKEQGIKTADSYRMKFYETSAKNNNNINEAFKDLIKNILEICPIIIKKKKGFGIVNKNNLENKKNKCCK